MIFQGTLFETPEGISGKSVPGKPFLDEHKVVHLGPGEGWL